MTTLTTSKQVGVFATRLTAEQLKADSAREYNSSVWEQRVNDYMKYSDVEFFKVEKGNGYEYERFFVSYTLPEGLKLLNTFGYSSCLSSNGFLMAFISSVGLDSNGQIETYADGTVRIFTNKIRFSDGTEGVFSNSREARGFMIKMSKTGSIFTKCSL